MCAHTHKQVGLEGSSCTRHGEGTTEHLGGNRPGPAQGKLHAGRAERSAAGAQASSDTGTGLSAHGPR